MVPLSAAVVLLLAAAWLAASYASARAGFTALALACIIAAGATIRLYAASEQTLHAWDERFHAVVAKHLIEHPLTPTLYDSPVLPYDYRDWGANDVWLHKPPLALWLIAGSLRVFGLHPLAVRLPDVVLSTLSIAVTFAIGRRLFGTPVALLAAGFHAVNGFLVALVSGRAPVDHVDSLLIVLIETGVFLAILDSERDRVWTSVAIGSTFGLALLTKWYPALLILPLWWFYLLANRQPWRRVAAKGFIAVSIGVAVAAPWAWHIARAFPREAVWEWRYAFAHAVVVMEEQRAGPFFFVADLPKFFGEVVYIPLAWAAVEAIRRQSAPLRLLALWVAIPYAVFSFAATKMPAYVMVAAPAVFLIEGWFWWQLAEAPVLARRRIVRTALLAIVGFLPGRYVLRPGGPFTIVDRHPQWIRDIEALRDRVAEPNAVLFNMPHPIEAMFYLPWPAYEQMPSDEQAQALGRRGYAVLVYDAEVNAVRPYAGKSIAR